MRNNKFIYISNVKRQIMLLDNFSIINLQRAHNLNLIKSRQSYGMFTKLNNILGVNTCGRFL